MSKKQTHVTRTTPSSTKAPELENFALTQSVKSLRELYSDDFSQKRRFNSTPSYAATDIDSASAVRRLLKEAISNKRTLAETSRRLYATNAIYQSVINYLCSMFTWQYKVVPHKLFTKSKAKARKQINPEDYLITLSLMLEVVDGLSFKTKCPALLKNLFLNGSVYYTTISDEDSLSIDTILLPDRYCRKIGETQFGTSIISFNCAYFDDLGLTEEQLKETFKSFPKEFEKAYWSYKKDSARQWAPLDPHFSSGILMNESAIPTYMYILGGIINYEKYQDNELELSENATRYLVVHTMPHYEDNLIFENAEVKALHSTVSKIVDTGSKARLVTTWGEIHVEPVSDGASAENEVLSKAFKAIFNGAGFNSGLFASESVEALKMSLMRDKAYVWEFVSQIVAFYNLAVNSWISFGGYQADIAILPISMYTYNDDIEVYKNNATLGVNKIGYMIASGIEQKNICDQMILEQQIHLDQILPMQTSYTQTAEDRSNAEAIAEESNQKDVSNSN